MIRLLVIEPGQTSLAVGQVFESPDSIVIGRDPQCGAQLDAAYISSHHARVFSDGGTYRLRDLGSTNGTAVISSSERRTVRASELSGHALRVEDVIEIGGLSHPVRLRVERLERPAMPTARSTVLAMFATEDQHELARTRMHAQAIAGAMPLLRYLRSSSDPQTIAKALVDHLREVWPSAESIMIWREGEKARGEHKILAGNGGSASLDIVPPQATPQNDGMKYAILRRTEDGRAEMIAPINAIGYAQMTGGMPGFEQKDLEQLSVISSFASVLFARPIAEETMRKNEIISEELQRKASAIGIEAPKMAGTSAAWRKCIEACDRAATNKIPVLILGESGTGKDVLARYIHLTSRRTGRFVVQNCAAIPKDLLESELFGANRGAAADVDRDRIGLFESANGGTLFLDEVADLDPGHQAKLLRVLENGSVRRLGATEERRFDARIIAATEQPIDEMVKSEEFRSSLLFRLDGIRITIPPLRERREDIAPLVRYHLGVVAQELEIEATIDQSAIIVLENYPFPGNVRELKAIIGKSVMNLGDSTVIYDEHLPEQVRSYAGRPVHSGSAKSRLKDARRQSDRSTVIEALRKHRGRISAAASELGITGAGLRKMLKTLNIDPTNPGQE